MGTVKDYRMWIVGFFSFFNMAHWVDISYQYIDVHAINILFMKHNTICNNNKAKKCEKLKIK